MQQSVKAVHNIAFEAQAKIGSYVLLKRSKPVSLSLPGVCAFPPYAVPHPMAHPLDYDPYRHMMPGPVSEGPYCIYATTIGADVPLQTNGAAVSVKIRIDKSVAPYPPALTVVTLADNWSRKREITPLQKNILDAHHEKKRQYPVPSGSGEASLVLRKNLSFSASGPFFLVRVF